LKERIVTGLIFGAVIIALLFINDTSRLLLLALIPLLAGFEYFQITNKGQYLRIGIVIAILLACGWLFIDHPDLAKYIIYLVLIINILLAINLFPKEPFIKHNRTSLLLLVIYICMPFVIAILDFELYKSIQIIVSIMILMWVADSGAYFVGSQIGKTKLFPKISPGKTWEGFIGAGMLTLFATYIISSFNTEFTFQFWIGFALLVWILGMIGDLIASHVKRIYQIKDSGSLLPGHGGFYDRFDSFIYILPFVLFYIKLFN